MADCPRGVNHDSIWGMWRHLWDGVAHIGTHRFIDFHGMRGFSGVANALLCWPQTVALDPRYGSRKTREFICGGEAGQLLLNSRVHYF